MMKYERTPFSNEMLRSFTTIAEHQHLTVAAHALNLTQSALSVHLRKMEAALGTQLFERHARGMKLTVDGEKLLPVAHHIL
jgi:DNA-binding transcriptional LysR family regulator